MPSDTDLIRRLPQRDEAAFRELLRRHGESVRARLRQLTRNDAASDDLLQEVSLRLWTRAAQWDGRGSVRGWLLRIATNLALNHLRDVRRKRELSLEASTAPNASGEEDASGPGWLADPAATAPDALLEAEDRAERLRQLLDQLPPEKRDVMRLAHEQEMRVQEIAETLGIPEGTVKSRLHYATRALADAWRRHGEENQP